MNVTIRPWGSFTTLYMTDTMWLKILTIDPGQSTSLQYHERRSEFWTPIDEGLRAVINGGVGIDLTPGLGYDVGVNVLHRIINPTDRPLRLIEFADGEPDEEDIVRIYDPYRR